jgi:hypothetical protein
VQPVVALRVGALQPRKKIALSGLIHSSMNPSFRIGSSPSNVSTTCCSSAP